MSQCVWWKTMLTVGAGCCIAACSLFAPSDAELAGPLTSPTCEDDGRACCEGGASESGLCAQCGGPGQECCDSGFGGGQCTAGTGVGLTCDNGTCVQCGGPGQSCCPGDACNGSMLVCGGDHYARTCEACGAAGQRCCANDTCYAGAMCNGGQCG